MKNILTPIVSALQVIGFRTMAVIAFLFVISQQSAFAVAGAVETAMLDGIGEAKTAGDNGLALAATVLVGFLIYKLVKRAANKA